MAWVSKISTNGKQICLYGGVKEVYNLNKKREQKKENA